jgi:hypothetical protein
MASDGDGLVPLPHSAPFSHTSSPKVFGRDGLSLDLGMVESGQVRKSPDLEARICRSNCRVDGWLGSETLNR